MYYYYVYITMVVYFLTDVMKWLRGKWNQLMKLVIPVWSSIGQAFCVPSMHNREFKFGYQHFLLCQKSFLKVSSKWLLKNKSDNGKLLLGKTYSGERFRAILALLFNSYLNFVRSISPNYTSYGYEILWVDRSYQGGVQCTWTVTLVYLFFEILPFVYFHTRVLSGAYLENYTCYGYEILWVDRSYQGGVQCI